MHIDQVPIYYMDNSQDFNLVLDLMFFYTNIKKFNNYSILPNLQDSSDHAPLSVYIVIEEKFIQEKTNYC